MAGRDERIMSTLTGTRVGRYEVLELLGAGGMGEVYRARDHDLHRHVAIKFLSERFARDVNRLARFAQEARAASSLNHPNIVTIHEIGESGGLPFIVMELVEGETLRQSLRGRPLANRRALDIAVQLADGLAKAHAAGIVHRDLKPENIAVTPDGFVKILDFGLAKLRRGDDGIPGAVAPDSDTHSTALSPETGLGSLLGTAVYMSPEQAKGETADFRADQFALGSILYEMATTRRAFERGSVVQTLAAIIDEEPEPVASVNPGFSVAAGWVIARCLAKEPQDRYASTLDLARELRDIREHLGQSDSARSGDLHPVPRPPRPRRWAWVATAALVVALLGLTLAGDPVWRWLRPFPLPGELRLAVLPVVSDADTATAPDCCAGIQEYVIARVADLQRFRSKVTVVPAAEVLESGARSPSAARRTLGANVALTISVSAAGTDRLVTVSLADTGAVRELRSASSRVPKDGFSPEKVVSLAAALLDLELGPDEERRWNGAAPQVSAAGALFAQGLGETPYQEARSALEQVDQQASLERAIDLFNKAVDRDPRYAAAHAGLAEARLWLYRLLKRPHDLALAADSAQRALQIDDSRPAAWTTLGMVRSARGDLPGAEQAFNEAIKRNPAGADVYRELGLAYGRAGQPEKAEAAHRRAITLDPGSWVAQSDLASFFMRQQRFAEAEQALRGALSNRAGQPSRAVEPRRLPPVPAPLEGRGGHAAEGRARSAVRVGVVEPRMAAVPGASQLRGRRRHLPTCGGGIPARLPPMEEPGRRIPPRGAARSRQCGAHDGRAPARGGTRHRPQQRDGARRAWRLSCHARSCGRGAASHRRGATAGAGRWRRRLYRRDSLRGDRRSRGGAGRNPRGACGWLRSRGGGERYRVGAVESRSTLRGAAAKAGGRRRRSRQVIQVKRSSV